MCLIVPPYVCRPIRDRHPGSEPVIPLAGQRSCFLWRERAAFPLARRSDTPRNLLHDIALVPARGHVLMALTRAWLFGGDLSTAMKNLVVPRSSSVANFCR